MPISAVLYLMPMENVRIRPTMGHHAHAAFLSLLQLGNPERAEQLHAQSDQKPFTVSPLIGNSRLEDGWLRFQAGTACHIRITFLQDDLFADLGRVFYSNAQQEIRLGSAIFRLDRLISSPSEKWSNHQSYQDLLNSAASEAEIHLKFYSPTAFRPMESHPQVKAESNTTSTILDLVRCFRSWVRKWNAFAPQSIDKSQLLSAVEQNLRLTQINGRLRQLDFGNFKENGFVGDCTFEIANSDQIRWINLLTDFAFYAGTGYKATMGMGQTRRLNGRNNHEPK
ncbi:MAG: CRISPR-associated endoribonuclease Cas6 [Candidatus Poribacteria bacterium]|jgi:CRISPR-associated endoribonuclease Cas6|nr:CRISPR-associated endoribonuclease Cas6 [Candidatus Poribacteria bacterium]MDP6750152.1 CRISPR-associated endoribonuclease Cas6 [Candidatus Poribacteria bacterium]MDP6998991.1 CRISPR-associated endoribonuclease Cas6 [Candidatus Poribacteria bacterium]MDP7278898.1 CRISPR-associated endoribonuclease Cas6 [Candidatus Poribacteria bacterium]